MKHAIAAGVVLSCLAASSNAFAQRPLGPGGFVNANIAIQEGSQALSLAVPVDVFGESGTMTVDDDLIGGALFDVSAGLRGGRFAFGLGFARSSTSDAHNFTATTSAPAGSFTRSVNGSTPDLDHSERTVYVFAGVTKQVSRKFDVMLAGGPAFLSMKQTVPTDLTVTDPGPVVRRIGLAVVEDTALGFMGSLDFNYMFLRRVGVGALVRYTWGSVDLPDSTESMTLGGLQVGAGVRLRF